MMTKNEAMVAMQLVDAGIRSMGMEVFAKGRGPVVQAILVRLEQIMQAPEAPADGETETPTP